jgi:SAM-dependent methyltransferase
VTVGILEAAPATRTCAWCERPLAGEDSVVRCEACGATTAEAPLRMLGICALRDAARRRARRQLAARIARVSPPGAVLDVGSGDGMLLDALRSTGRLVTGIERPPRRTGVRDAEITELGGRYAAIVFWQSLGRLAAPGTALEHATALLKPGGLLAIAQPSGPRMAFGALGLRRAVHEATRPHVEIPARSLLERLRALGLQIERVERPLDRQAAPGGWVQAALAGVVSIEARR